MSPNILYQFPMEYITLNSIQLTFLIGLVEFLLLNMIFLDKKRIYRFFSRFQLSISSDQLTTTTNDSRIQDEKRNRNFQSSSSSFKTEKKSVDESLSSKEVEIVLTRLGMIENSEAGTIFPAIMDANYIFNLFEERIPCLDEIKEAFDVFDENRDGFIDARELQKVLSALGLKEGLMVENCRRMIGMFDENGDGMIDFDEFVKFMETSSL